jgi:hypothetical protein
MHDETLPVTRSPSDGRWLLVGWVQTGRLAGSFPTWGFLMVGRNQRKGWGDYETRGFLCFSATLTRESALVYFGWIPEDLAHSSGFQNRNVVNIRCVCDF